MRVSGHLHLHPLLLLSVGSLYPTSMRIGEEGRLAVNFKTEAQFHGLFVLSHPGKPCRPWAATSHRTTSSQPHRSQQVSQPALMAFISYTCVTMSLMLGHCLPIPYPMENYRSTDIQRKVSSLNTCERKLDWGYFNKSFPS